MNSLLDFSCTEGLEGKDLLLVLPDSVLPGAYREAITSAKPRVASSSAATLGKRPLDSYLEEVGFSYDRHMPQALSAVHLHAVFSTKDRRPLLRDPEIRLQTHNYLGGISNKLGCPSLIVGGVEDHVHILAMHSRTLSQADWIKELKRASSLWLKDKCPGFAWQGGYGVFAVSVSQIPTVKEYIANQEEHHRKGSFQEELLALLRAHDLEWDERYIWD